MVSVLIPGSYDPITLGHMDMITRAASIFDKVYVGVMINDAEKYGASLHAKNYMFTLPERVTLARIACSGIPNTEVVSSSGMLIDFINKLGVSAIIKGVRDEEDFIYEQKHAEWNRAYNPKAQTLYLPADKKYINIRSTMAREAIKTGCDLTQILPAAVIEKIRQIRS